MRQSFLGKVPFVATFPNLIAQPFEDRPCAHAARVGP
jgi:hypothetical protein